MGDYLRLTQPRTFAMTALERRGWGISLLTVMSALGGCDIPTDAPILEQDWLVPISATSIDVGEFLPDDVDLNEDSSAFTFQVDPVLFSETLGGLCGACQGLDGLTVPKPPFEGDFHETLLLPSDVQSAEVLEGRVSVAARNLFGFDPLRPPGGEKGTVTLALHDGGPEGPVLDQIVVKGEDTSFGPGTTITRTLEYSGHVGSSLSLTVSVNSPAGGPQPGNWVTIRLNDEIRVTVTTELLEAESAEVSVKGEVFDLGVTNLNVADVSSDMVDQVKEGSFKFEIVNPWSVGGILNFTINGPTMEAPVILIGEVPPSPTSTVEVQVSEADLKAFLGEPNVTMSGQGTADQDAGTITVAPGQVMLIHTRLGLVIQVG